MDEEIKALREQVKTLAESLQFVTDVAMTALGVLEKHGMLTLEEKEAILARRNHQGPISLQ